MRIAYAVAIARYHPEPALDSDFPAACKRVSQAPRQPRGHWFKSSWDHQFPGPSADADGAGRLRRALQLPLFARTPARSRRRTRLHVRLPRSPWLGIRHSSGRVIV